MRRVPPDAQPGPTGAPGELRRVVVVGAGLAGAATVRALRDQGFAGQVTVLGAEGLAPYDRPPLSKQLLSRSEPVWLVDDLGLDLAAADEVRLAEPATALSAGTGHDHPLSVRTTAAELPADAVVLACGATAVRPAGWAGALTLHTAADAARLRAALRPGARLVVVGAGWIGAEVAGVAAAAGVEVTVVEAADAPLATALGGVGALTGAWYAEAGVRLLTGARVTGVTAGAVTLAGGETLAADVVLVAVGARPATDWLGGALPREPSGALRTDGGFRVLGGPPRVVAVGDVALRASERHGWVPGGHWDAALRGPAVAVRALLGDAGAGTRPADDVAPYVFSTQLGHELSLHGQPGPADDVVLRGDPAHPAGALWFAAGTDRLTAALALDRPRDVAAARRLFTGPELPHLDRVRAADADRPLKDAVL